MKDNNYEDIVNKAIDYIQRNIEKNITAEDIADHCCFSKFYFNRMFRAVVGESVYSFAKRRKLETAAFLLRTNINMPITEIAFRIGYSPSNFATAFKEYYGANPTEYRRNINIPVKDSHKRVSDHIKNMMKVEDYFAKVNSKIEIRKIGKMKLLYERFIGNYKDLALFWENFCVRMEAKGLITEDTVFIGISYDDPFVVDEDKCIYDVCLTVDKYDGVNTHIFEEGYYACYKFHDNISNMGKAFNEVFSLWLPFTEYETEHRMPLEIYYSQMEDDGKIMAELCIPISKDE